MRIPLPRKTTRVAGFRLDPARQAADGGPGAATGMGERAAEEMGVAERAQAAPAPSSAASRAADVVARDDAVDVCRRALAGLSDLRASSGQPDGLGELGPELRALRARMREVLVGLDGVMFHTATGIARSGLEMASLVRNMGETHEATVELLESTRQVQQGADEVARSAVAATALASETKEVTSAGLTVAEEAEGSITTLRERMEVMVERLGGLVERVGRITEVSGIIGEIARQTNMLALNAAIEAARAGQAGRGFAVVAAEVKRLANDTGAGTRDIAELLEAVKGELEPTRRLIDESLALVQDGSGKVSAAGAALQRIDRYTQETARHMEQIAGSVAAQTSASWTVFDGLGDMAARVEAVRGQTERVATEAFGLAAATEEAYRHLAAFRTDTIFHTALELGRELRAGGQALFEERVAAGRVSLEDVLALEYQELRGRAISRLGRFFDVSRVPPEGFDPPKYSTAYDALLDEPLQQLCDDVLAREDRLVFAVILDLNAYVPTHNRIYCQDWTGDPVIDNGGNRLKRIFSDSEVLLRGSRMGLGAGASRVPLIASRQDFVRAGCPLHRPPGEEREFLVQTYARDTGEVTSALSLPFYVQGERFGSVFLGWLDARA